ncbi:hypothetical protein HDU67_003920 [Dinochytrium kinnereticum]|nr:hypothetical protein HDU67_003920 [Dinochytrium kinnereticum]
MDNNTKQHGSSRLGEPVDDTSKEEDIIQYVLQHSAKGDPVSVLKAFDDYGYQRQWFMAVGDVKGAIVDEVMLSHKAVKVMAEIGGYIGYSAIRFARNLPKGSKYLSFEFSPAYAALAQKAVNHAGLEDVITIIVGPFDQTWVRAREAGGVDVFFIDHLKTLYLSDFKLIEENKLYHPGTLIIADNVIRPGAPDLLNYVSVDLPISTQWPGPRSVNITSHKLIMTTLEYTEEVDGISVAVMA